MEEKFYEQVMDELNTGQKREGLWAKALVLADGNEGRTTARSEEHTSELQSH